MAQIKTLVRRPHRRHRHRRPEPDRDGPARLQGTEADGLQRAVSGQQQRLRDAARRRWASCASTIPASPTSPKTAKASASASAAASSACSTAKSSSSGSNATASSNWSTTAPNVTYEILTRKGEIIVIDNPQKVPDAGQIEEFREPFVRSQLPPAVGEHRRPDADCAPSGAASTSAPSISVRRGRFWSSRCRSPEVIYDLYDKLKSVTHGYGTMDYDVPRLPRGRPGASGRAGTQQPRRCAVDHRAPGYGRPARAASW